MTNKTFTKIAAVIFLTLAITLTLVSAEEQTKNLENELKQEYKQKTYVENIREIRTAKYDETKFYHVEIELENGQENIKIINKEGDKVETQRKLGITSILLELQDGGKESIGRILDFFNLLK